MSLLASLLRAMLSKWYFHIIFKALRNSHTTSSNSSSLYNAFKPKTNILNFKLKKACKFHIDHFTVLKFVPHVMQFAIMSVYCVTFRLRSWNGHVNTIFDLLWNGYPFVWLGLTLIFFPFNKKRRVPIIFLGKVYSVTYHPQAASSLDVYVLYLQTT